MARKLNPRLCPFSSMSLAAFLLGPIPDIPPVIARTDEEKINMTKRAIKLKLPVSKQHDPRPSYTDDRWNMLWRLMLGEI